MTGGYATSKAKAYDDLVSGPFGRKAYGCFYRREGRRPEFWELRKEVQRYGEDRCPSVKLRTTCPGVPGWMCTRDVNHEGPCALLPRPVNGRIPDRAVIIDDLTGYWAQMERNVYTRIVDAQSQREGDLMRPRDYEDGPTQPADSQLPTIVDRRSPNTTPVDFDDIPNGAFVEHVDSRNVGVKSLEGISWLNHGKASGGFSSGALYRRPAFHILNVTITINR